MIGVPRGPTLALALAAALCGAVQAQELGAWFAGAPAAPAYATEKARILALGERARVAGVPERLLADRLNEGALKRIDPKRLASALEAELLRLAEVAALLETMKIPPRVELSALIAEGGLLLRGGISRAEMAAVLGTASGSAPEEKVERAFAALGLSLSVRARFPYASEPPEALAAALASSSLPRSAFDSLLSVFARWRAVGISAARIAEIAAETIGGGGTIERIHRELERRSRKP